MSCCVLSWYIMFLVVLCYITLCCVMLRAICADFLYVFRKSSRLHERKRWFLYMFRLTERFYEVSLSTFGPSTRSQEVDAFLKQFWCKIETHVEELSKQFQAIFQQRWRKFKATFEAMLKQFCSNSKTILKHCRSNFEALF